MADKKPDLSDLKARLGLTKPAPSSPPPAASGPPQAAGPPGASGPSSSGPPPSAGPPGAGPPSAGPPSAGPPSAGPPSAGPPSAGPPAAAPPSAGPPQATRAPAAKPQRTTTTGPTYSGNAASASIDLGAIDSPGLDRGKTFSGPVFGAIIVAGLVGAAFMWAMMSGVNARQLIEIQQQDAAKLRDAVKPKIASFEETAEKITKLSATTPQFELADELATSEFVVPGSILASVTIPLPGMATDNVANYAADSAQLMQMLNDHKRYTNGVDKEELTQLMEDNKAVAENTGFGVVIKPQAIAEGWEKEDYRPQMGTLVGFKKIIEESGKVEIAILPAGDIRQVPINEFIPIDKAQILKAGGQNAMQRYSYRVRNIKFQANKIAQYTPALLDSLEVAAGGESTRGAAAPAAEEPAAEEPAAE